jgi:hypothetical protein
VLFLIAFARSRPCDRSAGAHFAKRLALLALAVLCLFAAGEEISWGQRLLGYGTPEGIRSVNEQGELNVHNLAGVESWFGYLASAFWAGFAVLLPLASALHEPTRRFLRRYLPIYPASLALLFVANFALARSAREVISSAGLYQGSEPIANTVLEIREMTVAVLFAAGALYVARSSRIPGRTT